VGTVTSSGNLGSQTRYTAFGETRGAATTSTDYLYTGQRAEGEIGLYFYNARWYDPYLNRFLTVDSNYWVATSGKVFSSTTVYISLCAQDKVFS